ncbi:protein transport protein S31 [Balamuthia mandrillaris]
MEEPTTSTTAQQQQQQAPYISLPAPCDALVYSDSDKLAVATSNLTGKIWDGEVLIFEGKNKRRCFTTASGNCDICWLGPKSEYAVSATDEGAIFLWSLLEANVDKAKQVFAEHDDTVSALCVGPNNHNEFVSGSWDTKAKIWDTEEGRSSVTLEGHLDSIYTLDWNKKDPNMILTGGKDKRILHWDKRQGLVAQRYQMPCGVFSVAVNPQNEHVFAAGLEDAVVHVYDTRKPTEPLIVDDAIHEESVRKVVFSPHDSSLLACAADDATVTVFRTDEHHEKGQHCYRSEAHRDYVRGLAWNPDKQNLLASGGWDKAIYLHTISS